MKKKIGWLVVFLILCCLIGLYIFFKAPKEIEKIYLTDSYYTQEEGSFIKITKSQLKELSNENYILYIYNSYCKFPIPCDHIFEEFMKSYHIRFLSLPFTDFRETSFYPKVKYAPSIIVMKQGKIMAYLDANSDKDTEKYQNVDKLKEWLEQYIYLTQE